MWLYAFLKVFFFTIYRLFFRAEFRGVEHIPMEGRVILAANHMSNADPPLIGCHIPRNLNYMCKEELFHVPFIGWVLRTTQTIPVKRGTGDRGAIRTAQQALRAEKMIALFPEGHRSRDGRMRKAQPGVGLLAALSGAPVIPVCIIGTDRIFANGGHFPKLKVIYGEPLQFTGDHKDKEALAAFSQQVMDRIAALKAEYQM